MRHPVHTYRIYSDVYTIKKVELNKRDDQQGDWANTEIQFKYEKIKFHDLFNRSMEIVFQKIQKWDI